MRYFFGLYHWQRHVLAVFELIAAVVLAAAGIALWSVFGLALAVVGVVLVLHAASDLRILLKPSPFTVDRERFDVLADALPLANADTVLDVGCGTGRSIVGLAPHLNAGSRVIGLDRFDDRIILGNTPEMARWNARRAGIGVDVLQGDATAIPLTTDSMDIVVVGQVLHDLPEDVVRDVLRELARVLSSSGCLGLIELPLINDESTVPPSFWVDVVEDEGFTVDTVTRLPWKADQEKIVLTATPK